MLSSKLIRVERAKSYLFLKKELSRQRAAADGELVHVRGQLSDDEGQKAAPIFDGAGSVRLVFLESCPL